MTWLSLGSLALPFQLQRQGVSLKSDIARLGVELTTGEVAAPQRHLRGDTGPLAAIESRLARIDSFEQSARFTANRLDATQSSLAQVAAIGDSMASRMMTVSATNVPVTNLDPAGRAARDALQDVVGALSLRVAGQAAFSGVATDTDPLPDADTILSAIVPLVSGLSSVNDVQATVESVFMDPGGLFETTLYQGAAAAPGAMLGSAPSDPVHPTAADPAFRRLLAGLVSAALVAEPSMSLAPDQRRTLAQTSAETLLGAAPDLAGIQARVGDMQASLDARLLQFSTERDALRMSRASLIGVDPYEAATRLEETRVQLETLYSVTARTSRLTLAGYL